jgi:hypothetical protein
MGDFGVTDAQRRDMDRQELDRRAWKIRDQRVMLEDWAHHIITQATESPDTWENVGGQGLLNKAKTYLGWDNRPSAKGSE